MVFSAVDLMAVSVFWYLNKRQMYQINLANKIVYKTKEKNFCPPLAQLMEWEVLFFFWRAGLETTFQHKGKEINTDTPTHPRPSQRMWESILSLSPLLWMSFLPCTRRQRENPARNGFRISFPPSGKGSIRRHSTGRDIFNNGRAVLLSSHVSCRVFEKRARALFVATQPRGME